MKFDLELVKKVVVGAVDVWLDCDGFHFSKCSKKQLLAWENISSHLLMRAQATTGVRFDFYTDSTYLNLETASGERYEVIVDEIIYHQFVKTADEKLNFSVNLGNSTMKHVVVVLPSHSNGVIRSITIDDDAKIERRIFDRKLLFLGDSITQGWESNFDCLSYAYQVSEFLNAESVIQGIGSACFEPETVMDIGFVPDTIFVAYGTNDFVCRDSLLEIRKNVENFLRNLKKVYNHSSIFVISPIWRTDYDTPSKCGNFKDCCALIKLVAQKNGLRIIDGDKLVPHHVNMFADHVHPNDLGFSKYTINLLKLINKEN